MLEGKPFPAPSSFAHPFPHPILPTRLWRDLQAWGLQEFFLQLNFQGLSWFPCSDLSAPISQVWEKGRRGSAKHRCTTDLLKSLINCCSLADCGNYLVLMNMGKAEKPQMFFCCVIPTPLERLLKAQVTPGGSSRAAKKLLQIPLQVPQHPYSLQLEFCVIAVPGKAGELNSLH